MTKLISLTNVRFLPHRILTAFVQSRLVAIALGAIRSFVRFFIEKPPQRLFPLRKPLQSPSEVLSIQPAPQDSEARPVFFRSSITIHPSHSCDHPLPSLKAGEGAIPFKLGETIRDRRVRVFQDTEVLYQGWPSTHQAVRESHYYRALPPLPPSGRISDLKISVEEGDTLTILLREARAKQNPVGLNLANNTRRGGGVKTGANAQEEELCRRSDYLPAMNWYRGTLNTGCLYTPHVTAFREGQEQDYALTAPIRVSFIASAARHLSNPTEFTPALREEMKMRIRNILRAAAIHSHRVLILGALGCGVFNNPSEIVALCFKEVLEEREFQGYFDRVIFGLYVSPGTPADHKDRTNLKNFQKVFPAAV